MRPFEEIKNIKQRKLKGGALFYTLLIATLIGITSTCFVGLLAFQKSSLQQLEIQQTLQHNVASGVKLLKKNPQSFLENKEATSLFESSYDSVFLSTERWGAFLLGKVKAFHQTSLKQLSYEKSFLLGQASNDIHQAALYLVDNSKPLNLVGNTYIKGTAFLPQAGIKAGFINTEGYAGEHLIYGESKTSSDRLPEIRPDFWDFVKTEFANLYQNKEGSNIPDSLTRSFSDSTFYIHRKNLFLDSGLYQGKIIISADSLLRIGPGCSLEDVILIAPNIIIDQGFKGALQAFATNSLYLAENAALRYPSVAAILSLGVSFSSPTLHLEKGSKVEGLVLGIQYNQFNKRFPMKLKLKPGSLVSGQVFSNSLVQAQGAVHGNIMTKKFLYDNIATLYENFLYHSVIDQSKRNKYYLNPYIIESKAKTEIVKWLP